jgi:hypothetical protein
MKVRPSWAGVTDCQERKTFVVTSRLLVESPAYRSGWKLPFGAIESSARVSDFDGGERWKESP